MLTGFDSIERSKQRLLTNVLLVGLRFSLPLLRLCCFSIALVCEVFAGDGQTAYSDHQKLLP